MCFYSKTKKLKRVMRPIRVYKWLSPYSASPIFGYIYHKGMNVPNEKIILEIDKYSYGVGPYYSYGAGVLKEFKKHHFSSVEMYIPIGAKYNNDGVVVVGDVDCRDQIISTKLYWPKNKFEKWWYNLISKKY